MRDVDEGWPAPGTRLHHSVGTWPLTIDDTTDVVEAVPEQRLVLAAHAWPAGRAEIVLTLHPKADQPTSATETEIVFTERATDGPAALLPTFIQDPLLNRRNVESLRRLAFLVERR